MREKESGLKREISGNEEREREGLELIKRDWKGQVTVGARRSATPASCRLPWPFGREIVREGERMNPLPLSSSGWPTMANQTRFKFFFF